MGPMDKIMKTLGPRRHGTIGFAALHERAARAATCKEESHGAPGGGYLGPPGGEININKIHKDL